MVKYIIPGKGEVNVIHTMANGTVRDNLIGYIPDFKAMDPVLKKMLNQWICTDIRQNRSQKGL